MFVLVRLQWFKKSKSPGLGHFQCVFYPLSTVSATDQKPGILGARVTAAFFVQGCLAISVGSVFVASYRNYFSCNMHGAFLLYL